MPGEPHEGDWTVVVTNVVAGTKTVESIEMRQIE